MATSRRNTTDPTRSQRAKEKALALEAARKTKRLPLCPSCSGCRYTIVEGWNDTYGKVCRSAKLCTMCFGSGHCPKPITNDRKMAAAGDSL